MSPILASAAILVGIWQFTDEQRQINKRELELLSLQYRYSAEKDKLEVKRALFLKTIDAAARVAIDTSSTESIEAAKQEYLSIYYGSAALEDDEDVKRRLVQFKDAIFDTEAQPDPERLKRLSVELAKSMFDALSRDESQLEELLE